MTSREILKLEDNNKNIGLKINKIYLKHLYMFSKFMQVFEVINNSKIIL